MSTSREEIATMVADCEARESKLTNWERDFIDSVAASLAKGDGLTRKQEQTLADIWERIT